MKKIISLMLVLVMCLGVLTACNPLETIQGLFGKEKYDLDAAKAYLKQIYVDYLKDNETDTAFSLVTGLDMSGVKYSISWAVNNEAITLTPSEDGTKVTVTFKKAEEPIEYALTATITAPDGTSTEYVLNLVIPKSNVIPIADALAAADGTKVTVRGTVVDIGTAWDDGYKNISVTIKDEAGNKLYLYRLKTKVELGDIIVATGEMATYNNARQMAAGGTAEIEGKDSSFVVVEAKEYTIPDALKLEDNTPVIIKGTVTKINTAWDDSYGNISVTISDADGNTLYVHRLKTKVALGDIITVTGKMTTYNEARQINAGATAEITGHDDSVVEPDDNKGDDNKGDETPAGSLPSDLTFENLANKGSGDDYLSANFSGWTTNGVLGQGYGGYLGFGRGTGAAKNVTLTSPAFTFSSEFKVVAVLKGYGSNGADVTSSLTFALVDKDGNVLATSEAIVPASNDTEYEVEFTLANGKTWADVSNLTVTFAKDTGNIGMKSLKFVSDAATTPDTGDGEDKGETPDTGNGEDKGETPDNPDTPATTTTWTVVTDLTTLKTGDKILIGNPSNGKLLSAVKTGYYNVGVDYSTTDFSKVTDDEIFVVTVNTDGSLEFTSVSGSIIALADSYSSLNVSGTNKAWSLTAKDGETGIYYIKNVARGNYLEWYSTYSNWSTLTTSDLSALFEHSLYVQSSENTDPEPTPTPDPVTGAAFEKVTADQDDWSGTYLLVWEGGNQAFDSTWEDLGSNVANGKDVTIVDGKIASTDDTKAITVIIAKVDGGYTLKTADGRYLSKSTNLTGYEVATEADKAGVVTIVWENDAPKMTGAGGAVYGVDIYKNHNRFAFINTKYVTDTDFAAVSFYKLAE